MTTITNPKNGATIESPYTNGEAAGICGTITSEFAQDLARSYRKFKSISDGQRYWLHKLACDSTRPATPRPAPAPRESLDVSGIVELFLSAKDHGLKFPKIRLTEPTTGREIRLSLAGEKSKYAGSVQVADHGKYPDNIWFGRIEADGTLVKGRDMTPEILAFLRALAADPAGIAAEYGRRTGSCCFCGKELTDDRSVAVGYGPICASHFALPWGNPTPDPEPADAAPDHDQELEGPDDSGPSGDEVGRLVGMGIWPNLSGMADDANASRDRRIAATLPTRVGSDRPFTLSDLFDGCMSGITEYPTLALTVGI